MADIVSIERRSKIMSMIRSKNTRPEIVVRSLLHFLGFRFRLHRTDLPGNPDIVLPRYKTAIFVQGCFWHGHSCKIGSGKRKPKSNRIYWNNKISRNIMRDKKNLRKIRSVGWKAIIIWECSTKNRTVLIKKIKPLLEMKGDA